MTKRSGNEVGLFYIDPKLARGYYLNSLACNYSETARQQYMLQTDCLLRV